MQLLNGPEFESLKEEKERPKKEAEETQTDEEPISTEEIELEIDKEDVTSKQFSGMKNSEFIVITGSIGSGKSSILAAISSYMVKRNGSVGIDGDLLLCGEKENTIFGELYDATRYKEALEVFALESDLKCFQLVIQQK